MQKFHFLLSRICGDGVLRNVRISDFAFPGDGVISNIGSGWHGASGTVT